jgi:hypothetical protein
MKKITMVLIAAALVCTAAFAGSSYEEGSYGPASGVWSAGEETPGQGFDEEEARQRAAPFAGPSYPEGPYGPASGVRSAEEEAARQRAAAEAAATAQRAAAAEARAAEEEAARQRAAEEAAAAAQRAAAEETEARQRAAAEAARAAEEEAVRQRAAEEAAVAAQRAAEEAVAAADAADEEDAHRRAAAEARAAEEEAARQRAAAEAAAAAQRAAAEEAEARRRVAEEAAARQRAAEEAAAAAQRAAGEAESRRNAAAEAVYSARQAAEEAEVRQRAAEEAVAEARRAAEEAIAASNRSAVEGKRFSFKIDIDTNLAKFTHTDIKNDEYIGDAPVPDADIWNFAANPNYDDVEISAGYEDPKGRYGGKIVFAFSEILDPRFMLGDVYGWGKIGFFGERLGKYTYRIAEKVGGDKDLGVLLLDVNPNEDISFGTSDSLGLGSDIFGSLSSLYFGPLEFGFFTAPNEYHVAKQYTPGGIYNSPKETVESYYTYKMGGNIKLSLSFLILGAAFRQAHLEAFTSTSTGTIQKDYGVYSIFYLPLGFTIAGGYSGRMSEDNDEILYHPTHHAIHLDIKFTGIKRLSIGLYNNLSFSGLEKDKTFNYDSEIAEVADVYDDQSSFVLYNQIEGAFDLTEALTLSLMVRNYYGTLTARNGLKGQDYGKDVFIAEGKVSYKIDSHTSLRGGLKFETTMYSTPAASIILKNDSYSISVPIGITLQW